MAKHDIVLLNTTSSGFETDLGNNVARVKGDADDLFSVRDSSGVNKFSVSTLDESLILNSTVTSSGHISSSLNSTASFGRIDVTNLVGDASQMTNTNETGHVSSSAQLASRISGAFQFGFELDGENRVISGSATSTGSFTRVFANVYSGDASNMFNTNEDGHFSGSAQLADSISGSFTRGITFQSGSSISGSATSTGSFGETIASAYSGNASQTTGVGAALATGTLSGSAQIASNISGAFNQGFELSNKTVAISGSATSTGSFGTIVIGNSAVARRFTQGISDTSELTGFSTSGLISSSAQLATNISGSFTSGMPFNNAQISGSATSTGSFSRVDSILSISGDASETTGVTLPTGVISGSAGIASYVSGAFLHGFEFTGLTREATLTGSYAGVSGSAFAYAGNDTTMSISSICGSDFDYRKYDRLNGRIKGSQAFEAGGVWKTSTALPAARSNHGGYGTTDAALITAGYVSPAYTASTLKFNGVTYSDSANMIQARGVVAGAGTQNSTAIFQGNSNDNTKYTEHYNGSTWSENSDRINTTTSGGGFGTQNAAVAVGGSPPLQTTELWNGSVWTSGPDHNQTAKNRPGSGGSFDAGIMHAGGTPNRYNSSAHTELWNGTTWTNGPDSNQSSYGSSLAGSSNSAHSVGIHCQLNGGNYSNIFDGSAWRSGPNLSNARGYAGTNAAGLSSCHLYAGGATNLSGHPTCTEIFTATNLTTGSFARVNFNGVQVHCMISSSITGFDSGHVSSSAQLASNISGAFQAGFKLDGIISGSSDSSLKIQSLEIAGTNNFANSQLSKNWDSALVRSATYGDSLASAISGAFQSGFSYQGSISGSSTSTGSFSRLQFEQLNVKEVVGDRKPVSGSMGHDTYISGSFKTDSHGKVNIPVRGKIFNSINTRQFTATGSMKDQKYRVQAGQLFVDNWGRLNMTVQTGSLIAQPSVWSTPTPTGLSGRFGGIASKSTTAGAGGQQNTWKQYDGITVKDIPANGGSVYGWTTGIQVAGDGVDDMITFSNGFPAQYDTWVWNGSAWYKVQKTPINVYSSVVLTQGTQNDSGFIGGQYSGPHGCTLINWNGTSFHNTGQALITGRYYANGSGTTNAGLVTGGAESASPYPSSTCTEEWNGTTWATGGALGRAQNGGAAGGTQNATTYYGGYPNAYTEEYNGTAWSTGPNGPNATTQAGGSGGAGNMMQSPGLGGTAGIHIFETAYVTGSADTYNAFSQNSDGKYLLTKKLQANLSPGTAGGATSGSSDGYGGGY